MFVAIADPDRSSLRYASAGHDPALLLKANGNLTELSSTGIALGILDDAQWTTETLTVGPGDRLLLATDGLTEAISPAGELFGRQRLARELEQCAGRAIEECISRIRDAINEHCGSRVPTDDMTLLALEIGEVREPFGTKRPS